MNVETTIKGEDRIMTLTNLNEQADVSEIKVDPAYITVSAGVTRNLGSYNSAKISVSLHYPCDPAKIDKAYPLIKNWVDEKITEEGKEIDEYLKSKKVSI